MPPVRRSVVVVVMSKRPRGYVNVVARLQPHVVREWREEAELGRKGEKRESVCVRLRAREAHCVQKLPSTQWVVSGNVQYVCVFGRFHQPVSPASAALEIQAPVACKSKYEWGFSDPQACAGSAA